MRSVRGELEREGGGKREGRERGRGVRGERERHMQSKKGKRNICKKKTE